MCIRDSRGYAWGMVTNGLGLTESRFRSLLDAGLRTVSVSLDGFEREHNYIRCNPRSYERALGALRMIVREPSLAYDVVTCVSGAMVPRLGEFCEMLVAEGVKHWRLFSIFPMGRAKDDPTLRMTDEQFRTMLEFIRQTRREEMCIRDSAYGEQVDHCCEHGEESPDDERRKDEGARHLRQPYDQCRKQQEDGDRGRHHEEDQRRDEGEMCIRDRLCPGLVPGRARA